MDNIYQIKVPTYAKMLGIEPRESNIPTEKDLEKVKKFYKKANTENIVVYEMSFCNVIPDRQEDVFSEKSIDTMVKTCVGKQLVNAHDTRKDCIGKIFDAYSKNVDYEMEDGTVLKDIKTGFLKFYIPNSAKYQDIINDIETGMKEYSSPGFTINSVSCSVCGKDYLGSECHHIAGKEYDGVVCHTVLDVKEVAEVSLVYLGAQYYSQIVKCIEGGVLKMDVKELEAKIEGMEKEHEDLQKAFDEYKEKYSEKSFEDINAKADALAELVKVFGENVSAKDLEIVKANAQIGLEARELAIKEVKRLKALVDSAKNLPAMEKTLERFLEVAEYSELKEYEKALSVEARELVPTGKQTETPEVEVKTNNKNLWK